MTLLEKSMQKLLHLSDSVSVNRRTVTPDTQQQQTERQAERPLHYVCKTAQAYNNAQINEGLKTLSSW